MSTGDSEFRDDPADGLPAGELPEAGRALTTLLKNIPGMAYRCRNDPSWTMTFLSGKCRDVTGYEPDELLGNRVVAYGDLIHSEDAEHVWSTVQTALEARAAFQLRYRVTAKDGKTRWVWEQGCGVFSADGRLEAIEGFITDITQQHQLEQTLHRIERVELLGRMAAGIAHDFGNVLTGVYGGLALLSRREHAPNDARAAEIIRGAANRAASLVSELLSLSRDRTPKPETADLGMMLSSLEATIKTLLHANCRLRLELPADLWPVRVVVPEIERVILNLVSNACDACTEHGGDIVVSVRNCGVGAGSLIGGDAVQVTVHDSGNGIDPAALPHIFEPFFTTKADGDGTGLGLATSLGIVTRHGGNIEVQSVPGQGTTFLVTLPAWVADDRAIADQSA